MPIPVLRSRTADFWRIPVAPLDPIPFGAGDFADRYLIGFSAALNRGFSGGKKVVIPVGMGRCAGLAGEDIVEVRILLIS